jgi:GGDEF domain-containing protein
LDTWTVVAFVDLDDFKAINDRYGHFTGDRLLRYVADQLRAEVEPDGAVGRIGGDEFLVIHSIPAAEDTLADLGDRLLVAGRGGRRGDVPVQAAGHRSSPGKRSRRARSPAASICAAARTS